MGELNWKQFLADEVTEMRGHLLKYPLNVDRMGKVTSLPGCKTFPYLGGEIGGAFLPIYTSRVLAYASRVFVYTSRVFAYTSREYYHKII